MRANEGGVTHGVVERLGYGPVVMVMVGVGLLIWVCLLVGVIVRRWA